MRGPIRIGCPSPVAGRCSMRAISRDQGLDTHRLLIAQSKLFAHFVLNFLIKFCPHRSRDPTLWWDRGCAENIQAWVVQRLHVVGTIGLTIGFFQVRSLKLFWRHFCFLIGKSFFFLIKLFGLIISMLLFCTMKYRQNSDTYKSYSPAMDSQNNNQGPSSNMPRHHADSFIDDWINAYEWISACVVMKNSNGGQLLVS